MERDEIRHERQQERRRERNMARMAPERRSKVQKDKERDISEKIALGIPDPKVRTNETQFDQRLFNQSKVFFTSFFSVLFYFYFLFFVSFCCD